MRVVMGRRWWQSGVGLLLASLVFLYGLWQWAIRPVGGDSPIRVVIQPGSSLRQVGSQLVAAGVIRSRWAWELWNRWRPWTVKVGTYELDPREDLPGVIRQLQSGRTLQVRVTIPEGWRLKQMDDYLRQELGIPDFLQVAEGWGREDWLPAAAPSLEGFLFPDTYFLPAEHASAQALIRAMLRQFQLRALPLWQQHRPPPDLTLLEWVTLASIVEKEAVLPQERPLIAGVFWNRLRLGMPLGADPTVEYFLNIRQTPSRRLTLAEVRTPSPYNTYLNPGLPPGPIASPGLASLQATLAPATTDYLYFVARYDGSHVFSRTLADHEAAQREILRRQAAGS
ncbi:MAG: endolytic transglycosylase MltG [Thermostichales cyanobacterium HHBFW_bins_127]